MQAALRIHEKFFRAELDTSWIETKQAEKAQVGIIRTQALVKNTFARVCLVRTLSRDTKEEISLAENLNL